MIMILGDLALVEVPVEYRPSFFHLMRWFLPSHVCLWFLQKLRGSLKYKVGENPKFSAVKSTAEVYWTKYLCPISHPCDWILAIRSIYPSIRHTSIISPIITSVHRRVASSTLCAYLHNFRFAAVSRSMGGRAIKQIFSLLR